MMNHNSVDAALDRRDWLAKCIYAALFRWLLARISAFLGGNLEQPAEQLQAKQKGKILLVDMPGNEVRDKFHSNSNH